MANKTSSARTKRRQAPASLRARKTSAAAAPKTKKVPGRAHSRSHTGSRRPSPAAATAGESATISPALRRELKDLGVRWQAILLELRRARRRANAAQKSG